MDASSVVEGWTVRSQSESSLILEKKHTSTFKKKWWEFEQAFFGVLYAMLRNSNKERTWAWIANKVRIAGIFIDFLRILTIYCISILLNITKEMISFSLVHLKFQSNAVERFIASTLESFQFPGNSSPIYNNRIRFCN
jgi:hypothetical protein